MSQSRKVIKDYSAIYLDGLLLDTTALGKLTLGQSEVGGSGSGTMGPIGLTGTMGPIGLTGTQGPIGLTGTMGPIGLTGTQGPIGLTGTMGPIGLTGTMGPIGLTGTQGPIGLTGTMGPIGLTGADGTMGPIGLTGTMGPSGVTGSSFANLFVEGATTSGSLTIGTIEGIAASISDTGVITCSQIIPGLFVPQLSRATQGTSITTDIAGNYSQFGSIVTVSTNLATQASAAFSVQNAFINPNTRVISNIINYNGTGLPSVYVSSATTGVFTMTLQNNSISDPLNGTVEIGYIALGV